LIGLSSLVIRFFLCYDIYRIHKKPCGVRDLPLSFEPTPLQWEPIELRLWLARLHFNEGPISRRVGTHLHMQVQNDGPTALWGLFY
jgi:hypothetical protein